MKDEIKEILDEMLVAIAKYSKEDFEEMGINYKIELTYTQLTDFYDYITNLQERNKELVLENISLEVERNTYKLRCEKAIEINNFKIWVF